VNNAFEEIMNLSRDKIIGKKVTEVYPDIKESSFGWIGTYGKVALTGETIHFEQYFEMADRWYDVTAYSDQLDYFAVVFHDITDRKQAEEALKESKERYSHISEILSDIAYSCILKEDGNYTIDWMTGAVELITGYTIDELKALSCWRFIVLKEDLFLFEQHVVGLAQGASRQCELRIRHKNGDIHWLRSFAQCSPQPDDTSSQHLYGGLIDITERKQAEEDLAKAEQRLSAHIDNSPLAIIEFDPQFRVIRWSKVAERIFGWTSEEIIGKSISEMRWIYDDDKELVLQESAGLLKGERSRSLNVNRNYWKDGSIILCEWYDSGIYDETGHLISIFSQVLDITERKQAEEELLKSKALLSDTERTGKIGGWEFNAETLTQTWTDETFRILEIDSTKGEPKVPEGLEFITPVFRPLAEQAIRRAIEYGEPYDQEREVITAKGNKRWVHSVAKAHQEQGKTKRISGSFQDITERKQAEEALRKSHERFQLANRATFNAIWDWNLQTDALWWNENFQVLFGYRAEEIEPGIESWINRIHPEDVDRIKVSIHTAIDSGQQSWSNHYRFRRKDGVYAEVEDRGYISREANGKPVRMIGAMQDITEHKQAELLILIQRDLALAISFSHQLDEALSQCLDTILQLSEMDCGGIYLMDQTSGDLNLICHRNLSSAFIKSVSHYKADSTHTRLVLQGKPLFTRYSELALPLNQVSVNFSGVVKIIRE
jgi:PAS domain S-box-containing protein